MDFLFSEDQELIKDYWAKQFPGRKARGDMRRRNKQFMDNLGLHAKIVSLYSGILSEKERIDLKRPPSSSA